MKLTACLTSLVGLLLTFPLNAATESRWTQPVPGFTNLYAWADTCNVYALRDGPSAMLIDLGNGSVLDHLEEIGVERVEWVLFTHHHREQCQGYRRLNTNETKVAAPEAERALFERPLDFRKMNVRLEDAHTIHGASYVRPPMLPIRLDQAFKKADTFSWHDFRFTCLHTPGNSPGAMSYLLERGTNVLAFSGDVMLAGGKMHTWFDTEWDYGFGAGIYAIHNAAGLLAGYNPAWLLPAHGAAIRSPKKQLHDYALRLRRFEKQYLRGYHVSSFSGGYQDKVSLPTKIPNLVRVSPHLFKFRGPDTWVNFSLLLADSGHALVIDCGLLDEAMLDRTLNAMRTEFGLKQIDAAIITHMHGDHFLEAPYLREKWNTKIWALERMGPVCEFPERFDYAAPIQAYGKKGVSNLRFDRLFKDGEQFTWEGYKFTVDWMPGQTEFALCLHGEIDGRYVAFTGDNLFGDPDDPEQSGHEAMVAHNSAILEEGYILGAEFLWRLKPDILVGGHSYVMDNPLQFIRRFRDWSYQMRDLFQSFSDDPDYEYMFDPYWIRAEPYRLPIKPGESAELTLHVRNFRSRTQNHRIQIQTPPGFQAEPAVLESHLLKESRQGYPVRLRANSDAAAGRHLITFDVTLDGRPYGQWFDCLINVTP